ncbi:hypothetical protein FI667_g7231, partial [Globisporangium splendens]
MRREKKNRLRLLLSSTQSGYSDLPFDLPYLMSPLASVHSRSDFGIHGHRETASGGRDWCRCTAIQTAPQRRIGRLGRVAWVQHAARPPHIVRRRDPFAARITEFLAVRLAIAA